LKRETTGQALSEQVREKRVRKSEAGYDDNIHLWVAKKPKQVLKEHNVTPTREVKYRRAQMTIAQQEDDGYEQCRVCGQHHTRPNQERVSKERTQLTAVFEGGRAYAPVCNHIIDSAEDGAQARREDHKQCNVYFAHGGETETGRVGCHKGSAGDDLI